MIMYSRSWLVHMPHLKQTGFQCEQPWKQSYLKRGSAATDFFLEAFTF